MNRERLKERLRSDEGVRSHVYKCTAGKNTIGIGRNLDGNPIKPYEWEYILNGQSFIFPNQFLIDSLLSGKIGLTNKAIEFLFDNDIDEVEKQLRSQFNWFENLCDARQEMLMNFCYQVGIVTFMRFKKMIAAFERNDFNEAANQFKDSKYWRERKSMKYRQRAERIHKVILEGNY